MDSCENIDECTAGTSPCDSNAVCEDTQGSYNCACNSGYQGDGKTCTELDECAVSNPCADFANCTNLPGSFKCTCIDGYVGNGAIKCLDVDECSGDESPCVGENRMCTNNAGSFTCPCHSGYTEDSTSKFFSLQIFCSLYGQKTTDLTFKIVIIINKF